MITNNAFPFMTRTFWRGRLASAVRIPRAAMSDTVASLPSRVIRESSMRLDVVDTPPALLYYKAINIQSLMQPSSTVDVITSRVSIFPADTLRLWAKATGKVDPGQPLRLVQGYAAKGENGGNGNLDPNDPDADDESDEFEEDEAGENPEEQDDEGELESDEDEFEANGNGSHNAENEAPSEDEDDDFDEDDFEEDDGDGDFEADDDDEEDDLDLDDEDEYDDDED